MPNRNQPEPDRSTVYAALTRSEKAFAPFANAPFRDGVTLTFSQREIVAVNEAMMHVRAALKHFPRVEPTPLKPVGAHYSAVPVCPTRGCNAGIILARFVMRKSVAYTVWFMFFEASLATRTDQMDLKTLAALITAIAYLIRRSLPYSLNFTGGGRDPQPDL